LHERFHGKGSFVAQLVPEGLHDPTKRKRPATIFVGSMTDIGRPDMLPQWVRAVSSVMVEASWHRYLLLSKRPLGYADIAALAARQGWWCGATVDSAWYDRSVADLLALSIPNVYLSFEPLLGRVGDIALAALRRGKVRWAILGACTGPGAFMPPREQVEEIMEACRVGGVPVFVKDNLVKGYPDLAQYRAIPYLEA